MRTALLRICLFALVVLPVLKPVDLHASHAMGMDLTYECITPNTYKVTVTFYRDCEGIPAPSSFFLNVSSASCGQNANYTLNLTTGPTEVSQLCDPYANQSECFGGAYPGVEQYIYIDTVVIPMQCTDWTFSTSECCRNATITNLQSPSSYELYVEATLNNTVASCNNSPVFTILPVPYICNNMQFSYNHGAVDYEGDSLVYTLVNPLDAGGSPIGYVFPYNPTYPLTVTGSVFFDPVSGQFIIIPNGIQIAVVTFLVEEYRNGVLIGSTMRDMQLIIMTCQPADPVMSSDGIINFTGGYGGQLLDSNYVTICVGETLSFQITFHDTVNTTEIELTTNASSTIPNAYYFVTDTNPKTFNFFWQPGMDDLWGQTYFFNVTVGNDACPIIQSKSYLFMIYVKLSTYAGEDIFRCDDDTLQLYAIGGTNFNWTPPVYISDTAIQNPLVWPDTTFTYIVTSNLPSTGCKNTDTITIWEVSNFNLTVAPSTTICYGGSVQLDAVPSPAANYTITWSPATGLSDDSIANPMASPSSTTTYTVTVSHPNGCVKKKNVVVTVNPVPLTVDPTVDDEILCKGDSTILHANPVTGSCTDYMVTSVPFSAPVAGGYTNIAILSNDVVSSAIFIGFDFQFFCSWYDMVYVSSNGWLSFTSQASSVPTSQSLPDATAPNNIIAFAWANLNPGVGSPSIGYKVIGTSPNQVFILKFENVRHNTSTNTVTLYVKLFESSNIIEIHNQSVNTDFSFKTQGIENATGTIGYTVPGRNNAVFTAFGDAYRFTPLIPPPYTITWFDQNNDTLSNNADITVTTDSAVTYSVVITDGICIDQKNVSLNVLRVIGGPDVLICPGDTAQLSAIFSGSTIYMLPSTCGIAGTCNGIAGITNHNVGTGAAANTNTSWPAPYGNWYANAKHQFLYRASELNAAGIIGGTITNLAWYINSIQGTTTYYQFSIKMGCTNMTAISTWQSGLTTVFTPKTHNVVTGWNNHNLDFDYNWDGISNIIVEICYNNIPYSYTYNSISPYTNTGYSSCIYSYSDFDPMCPYTGIPTSTNNRPNTRFTVCLDTLANTYSWTPSPGLNNTTISNPKAYPDTTTQYVVTMTNAFCSSKDTILVTVGGILANTNTVTASCPAICDGAAGVNPTVGTPPFTYTWSDSQTTPTATGLCSGSYTVFITDSLGCEGTFLLSVPFGPDITDTISPLNNVLCAYQCNGDATVAASNGTPPYTYLWSPSTGSQSGATATALCAGIHYISISDSKGCLASDSVIITQPVPLSSVIGYNCLGDCNNSLLVSVGGGISPFSYLWSSGGTTDTETGLCSGTYSVTVTDNNNCNITDTLVLNSPSLTMVPLDERCKIPCSGLATAGISGGTLPYTYLWDDPDAQTDSAATGLCAGTFNVTFTDAAGCIMYDNAIINSAVNLAYDPPSLADVTCFDSCNGSATVVPLNATPPVTYAWSDPLAQNTPTASSLCDGYYSVTITDDVDCDVVVTVSITKPPLLAISPSAIDNSCFNKCDGEVQININGGTVPYSYQWSNGNSGTAITNVCAGDYTVTVYDNNGCNKFLLTTITEPPLLLATLGQYYDATCAVLCDGSANVAPTGGTPAYTYLWSDPLSQSSPNATGLCEGNYKATITDSKGCTTTVSQSIIAQSQVPEAGFYIDPDMTSMFEPLVFFYDSSSTNSVHWIWNMGDNYTWSTDEDSVFRHEYPNPGTYTITLVVRNDRDCPDTIERILIVNADYVIYIPNAFSPNGDGINDTYYPLVPGKSIKEYTFYIFNRWGDQIFYTDDLNTPWDGTANGSEKEVQEDVYIWYIVIRDRVDNEHKFLGRVTVVK